MSHPSNRELGVGLALADGSAWRIVGGDEAASALVLRLAEVMQLGPGQGSARRLLVLADGQSTAGTKGRHDTTSGRLKGTAVCRVGPLFSADMVALQLVRLSLAIAGDVELRGGLLLHGALVEREGLGAILAGPAGAGKTTAAQRLPAGWHTLCDDTTLVVRDPFGQYRAHPWPTWSTFMFGGPGGIWDVNHSIPLRGVFFLAQAPHDLLTPLGPAKAVCLVVGSAEAAWGQRCRRMAKDNIRAQRLQRFANACALAQAVPCYRLSLSRGGPFWDEMDRVLGTQDEGNS